MAKQNIEAIAKWQKEKTDFIRFRVRKENQIPDRVQMAVDAGKAKSRQDYYIRAIMEKLEHDGFPVTEIDDTQEDENEN